MGEHELFDDVLDIQNVPSHQVVGIFFLRAATRVKLHSK